MKKINILLMIIVTFSMYTMSCKESYENQDIIAYDSSDEGVVQEIEDSIIYVYVVGEVVNPGMYELESDARVNDAIEAAGGFTENAAKDYINLAGKVSDEEMIVVYSIEQVLNNEVPFGSQSSLVNINTADASRLMTLPGIGESKAADIIRYREKNGDFETIEDIMKVSGIKDAAFEKMKDYITVN